MGHRRFGLPTEYFRRLPGAAQVRAADRVYGVVLSDQCRGFGGFVESFLVERHIQPAAQTLIAARQVETRMSMSNNQQLSHIFSDDAKSKRSNNLALRQWLLNCSLTGGDRSLRLELLTACYMSTNIVDITFF